ncbi:hypothetical protein EGW08_019223 [Elysia chlorotica]|uniref:Uncharacterized protein n=1 Tax=Elysia chlorotica TaxID=188477 RepID=A0A3S1B660_ELYCH|nr:hypothetical protein EGW08_019223 [Elysia chlorotica]
MPVTLLSPHSHTGKENDKIRLKLNLHWEQKNACVCVCICVFVCVKLYPLAFLRLKIVVSHQGCFDVVVKNSFFPFRRVYWITKKITSQNFIPQEQDMGWCF